MILRIPNIFLNFPGSLYINTYPYICTVSILGAIYLLWDQNISLPSPFYRLYLIVLIFLSVFIIKGGKSHQCLPEYLSSEYWFLDLHLKSNMIISKPPPLCFLCWAEFHYVQLYYTELKLPPIPLLDSQIYSKLLEYVENDNPNV